MLDLRDAAWNEICKLPLVGPASDEKEGEIGSRALVERILRRFHRMARQIRRRYDGRPEFVIEDEHDVQDLLHTVLRGVFDDVRAEEYTPSYAGGAARMDFLLKKEKIVVETKLTSSSLRDRQVGEQLLIDIGRYSAHPDCKALFCFVYDPTGQLKNPEGLEADLTKAHDGLTVKVIAVSP